MNILNAFRIALRALAKNKMRAVLTVLGVVIGIAAVTTMVSIGQSAGSLVQGQFEAFGTNVIIVVPKAQKRGGVSQSGMPSLTSGDIEAIGQECDSVLAASALVRGNGQLVYGNENWSPRELWGVSPGYLTVRSWDVVQGGFFTAADVNSAAKVCVIGRTIARKLYPNMDPLDQTLRISNIPFRIVGVLDEKGANMMGEDQDDIVLMPFSTVTKRLWGSNFDSVHAAMISARASELMEDARNEIDQLLMERHKIAPEETPDFEVQNSKEFAEALGMITGTMTLLLAAIAGISLLVGGVGIMNIMLVSVTERTREIGIRMAVGAKGKDILRQFLVEAVVLSCIGGAIGFAIGVGASVGATTLINHFSPGTDWPIVISWNAGIVALLFAGCVGVFFGFYPARKASRLDPIDALRYE